MADFSSGWARVVKRGDAYYGQVGKVLAVEPEPSGVWVTLELGTEKVMFDQWEVMECPAPKTDADRG